MTKQDIINELQKKPQWGRNELKAIIQQMSTVKVKTTVVKNGDIFLYPQLNHPAIVIAKRKELYVCLILTSKNKESSFLTELDCRTYTANVSNTMFLIEEEYIKDNFITSTERKEVRRIKKEYKQFIKKLRL